MVNRKRIIYSVLAIILVFNSYFLAGATANKINEEKDKSPHMETPLDPLSIPVDVSGRPTFENENYKLYLEEGTLGLMIEDKASGFVYESTKTDDNSNASWKGFLNSGVTVEFYSQRSTMPERVDLAKGNAKKTFTYYKNGFDVVIQYPAYEFSMCLEVRLLEDGISTFVKESSITEGETYKLGSIYLYPMFGATKLDDIKGYMFVPEGSGALIDLKDNHGKYKTPYTKKIYGANAGIDKFGTSEFYRPAVTEPEDITIPVYGMIYSNDRQGFLGIIEEGQYNAEILAYPNGVTTEYNWITTKFNFREIYTMQTAESSGVPTYEKTPYIRDIGIRFKLVSGERANYTGLAKTYQNYLIDQGVLKKQEDNFQVKLDFFGADSKKWFIFDVVVPMTTVDQIKHIITDLVQSDIKDMVPVYTGWQKKGTSLNYGSGNYKIESKLGSENKLLGLMEELQAQNINLVLEQDLLWANPKRFYNTSKDIVKGINQIIVQEPTNAWIFSSMYYLTPTKSIELAKKFRNRYEDTIVDRIALKKIPNTLFSYYAGGDIYSRGDTANKYVEIMKEFDSMDLSMEKPGDYMWEYTSQYYDMPLSTSNYSYLSKEIPFLPIVLKGYIPYWASYSNFEANETKFFLKMIEYGAYPSFLLTKESPNQLRNTNSSYIYTSEYEVLKPMIKDYYEKIGEALRLVEGVGIASHNYVEDNVVSVVYENGVRFFINYSNKDFNQENVTVPAMSFSVY